MNARKTYLLGIAFFTVLFMALVLLGSWLLSVESKQFAVAAFLFAFAAVFGQIACLALYARQTAREKAASAAKPQENRHV
ncbi:NGO_0222 family membrane protein [Neisseria dentiae]|uniref:NGO_0222 family membrane protein n=1 Tax=Neisseria dentiae TaxID=194197 RepID=UPI0035A06024